MRSARNLRCAAPAPLKEPKRDRHIRVGPLYYGCGQGGGGGGFFKQGVGILGSGLGAIKPCTPSEAWSGPGA